MRDETAMLIDCLRYRPVATTAAQMRDAADEIERQSREILALREQVAALESREVCTVAHDNVETCGYCHRDALRKEAARMRGALEMLYPGLVLDLRYADADDDRDALQSRIDTVEEALVQSVIDAAIAKEPDHGP